MIKQGLVSQTIQRAQTNRDIMGSTKGRKRKLTIQTKGFRVGLVQRWRIDINSPTQKQELVVSNST